MIGSLPGVLVGNCVFGSNVHISGCGLVLGVWFCVGWRELWEALSKAAMVENFGIRERRDGSKIKVGMNMIQGYILSKG